MHIHLSVSRISSNWSHHCMPYNT